MIRLPFVIEPRKQPEVTLIGTEESGKIEVISRGYLTTGEKAFVQQTVGNDNGSQQVISLARRAGNKYGIDLGEIYDLVLKAIGNDRTVTDKKQRKIIADIRDDYAEDIDNVIQSLAELQAKENLIIALCMLKYRVNTDTGIDDVLQLHPDIVEGLVNLYRKDEAESMSRLPEATKKQEEDVSNQQGDEEEKKDQ